MSAQQGLAIELHGFEEFRAELRKLPRDLALGAGVIVHQTGDIAANSIRSAYLQLPYAAAGEAFAKATVVEPMDTGNVLAAGVRVRNKSKLADIFEIGAASRRTAAGAARGSITPGHVFVPRAVLARRRMWGSLVGLLESHGFVVKGVLDDTA